MTVSIPLPLRMTARRQATSEQIIEINIPSLRQRMKKIKVVSAFVSVLSSPVK